MADFVYMCVILLAQCVYSCYSEEYCGYITASGTYVQQFCSGYCCDDEYDNCCTSWGWIAGACVGAIVVLAVIGVIVFMVCAKMKARKNQTINVAMHRTTHQHTVGGYQAYNLNKPNRRGAPPQYAQYPVLPPPYTETSNQGAGPYGALPPPPPYSAMGTTSGNPAMYPSNSGSYPGTSGMQTTGGLQTTSLNTGDSAYPPPPVS